MSRQFYLCSGALWGFVCELGLLVGLFACGWLIIGLRVHLVFGNLKEREKIGELEEGIFQGDENALDGVKGRRIRAFAKES